MTRSKLRVGEGEGSVSEKEKLLKKLSEEEILELAKPLTRAPINSTTSRTELTRIIKGALSVEEIKRKKRKIEATNRIRARRRTQFLAVLVISVVAYGSLVFAYVSILNNLNVPVEEKWSKTYGVGQDSMVVTTEETLDGGYVMIGSVNYSLSNGTMQSHTYLLKTDSEGNPEWNSTIIGSFSPTCIDQTSDGGFLIAGAGLEYNSNPGLVKTDSSGIVQWSNDHIGTGNNSVYSVRQTSDGGYVIAGYELLPLYGIHVFWVERTDQSGNMLWNLTDKDNLRVGYAFSAEETPDGGYIIAVALAVGILVLKTDSNGEEQWSRLLEKEAENLHGNCLRQTSDGGYVVAGFATYLALNGGIDFLLVKIDQDGNVQWESTYRGNGFDEASWVQQTSDGGYVLAGVTYPETTFLSRNIFLVKADPTGHLEWEGVYRRSGDEEVFSVRQTSSGGYVIAGAYLTNQSFWLAEVEPGTPSALQVAIPVALSITGLVVAMCLVLMGRRLKRSRERSTSQLQPTGIGGIQREQTHPAPSRFRLRLYKGHQEKPRQGNRIQEVEAVG
jgi:hypothetical protein